MNLTIELEQEEDGRWLASRSRTSGLAYRTQMARIRRININQISVGPSHPDQPCSIFSVLFSSAQEWRGTECFRNDPSPDPDAPGRRYLPSDFGSE